MELKQGNNFIVTYKVTEDIYNGFIQLFNDKNPLHTNEDFAKQKNFMGKVMHGAILAGFLSNFIGEQLPLKNVIVLSYKIAFTKPVYLNTALQLNATVADVFESVNCVDIKYVFENEANVIVSKGVVSIKII